MKYKNISLVFVKIIITVAIVFLIKQKVQLSEIMQTLEKISISGIVTASAMIIVSTILTGYRWYYVLKSCGINTPVKNATFQIYKGFSVSQIMPSNIGGDIYRILAIKKNVAKYSDATALVMMDRILGMLSMLLFSIIMSLFFTNVLTSSIIGKMIMFLLVSAVTMMLSLFYLNQYMTKKIPILHQLMHYSKMFLQFKQMPRIILITLSITILYISPATILAKDIDMLIDFKVFLLVVPLITILSVVPISFAGWGVREGLMVFFLGIFGVPGEQALVLSVLLGSVNLISAAPGALLFLTQSNLSRQAP